jgi:aspartate carbamoyltransferase catalytic subunit
MAFSVSSSSVQKGESLRDTVQTIEAMGIDAVVVRHSAAGAPNRVASWIDASVINAGDGCHEHPTQALLDLLTLRRHLGASLDGARVAIVGDIAHSRVARSNVLCLAKLGARIRLVAPLTLIPRGIDLIGGEVTRERVRVVTRLEEGLDGVDVVMMLRIQHERFENEAPRFPNTRELSRTFGLSERTLGFAKPDAIVMHPGPINRGVELAPQVADGPRAVILQQVSWGVAIRMAVLERAVIGFDARPEGVAA